MNDKRIVKVKLMGKQWRTIPFSELVVGDVFCLFEPSDMTPVVDKNGNGVFVAMSKPFPDKDNPKNLGIDAEVLEKPEFPNGYIKHEASDKRTKIK